MEGEGEEKMCRNCHEGGGDLISPCMCSGSIRWVHRSCLDTWRANSPNPQSFYYCDICKYKYRLERVPNNTAKAWFVLKCARDVFAVLATVLAILMVLGFAAYGVQHSTHYLNNIVPTSWYPTVNNMWFQVFFGGLCVLSFIIGLFAICFGIAKCLGTSCCCGGPAAGPYTYNTYPYHADPFFGWYGWWWWYGGWYYPSPIGGYGGGPCCCMCCDCGDCNCSGGGGNCDCGSGDDAGKAILIVIVVVVVVIILIGFIVGMIALGYVLWKAISRQVRNLYMASEASIYRVIDLNTGPHTTAFEVLDMPAPAFSSAPPIQEMSEVDILKANLV